MGRILIALVALITMETAARADEVQLASGLLNGGMDQDLASCYIFNGSFTGITGVDKTFKVGYAFIVAPGGVLLELIQNDCTIAGANTLKPGRSCSIIAVIKPYVGYACIAGVNGPGTAGARGTLVIRNFHDRVGRPPFDTVLATQELR